MKLNFNSGSAFITVASGLISLGAILSMMRTPAQRPLLLNIFVASSSIAITNQLLSNYYRTFSEDIFSETTETTKKAIKGLETKLELSSKQVNKLTEIATTRQVALDNAQKLASKNTGIIEEYAKLIQQLKVEVLQKSTLLKNAYEIEDTRYREQLEKIKSGFHSKLSHHLVEVCNRLNRAVEVNLTKAKMPMANKPLLEFQLRIEEVHGNCSILLADIGDLEECSIIDVLDICHEVYHELTLLEIKWRGLLNINERLCMFQLNEQVKQYESEYIPKKKAVNALSIQTDRVNQELESLLPSLDSHRYDIEDLKNQVQDLLKQIESKNLELDKMRKPLRWSVATRQDLQIGNIIIGYFEGKGIILDRARSDFDHWQATLSFHIDRNNRIITPGELNPEGEKLQQLTHTLSPITFGWNSEEGLMVAWLHLAKKPVKAIAETDINKIWKTADKFPSIVKGWSRVRLTGGSESGKSPTAENLAVCILLSRGGNCSLYNPQYNSRKNFWTLPTVGHTHEDSVKGIAELAESVNGSNFERFNLTLFDEIDSSMVSVDKKEQALIGQNISTIIKQISHKNGGVIFIGQNANASKYPGMDRSDWNSAVNVHIGSNAYDALTNTNQITKPEQDRLKQQADKLTEYCDGKNLEFGLEKTHPEAYRFALVMGDGKPYFIQLPAFGEYTFDLLETAIKCPHCGSLDHISKGAGRRECKGCGKSFKE